VNNPWPALNQLLNESESDYITKVVKQNESLKVRAKEMGQNTDEISNRSEYGGSIPVDNVQALASKDLKDVPVRYLRPEIVSDEVLTDESLQIPELFKLMSINLGIDLETVSKLYENCTQGIRMNYYPPCLEADKVLGLAPHSDAVGLTLLVQVNEVQGLQIKKNSKWVPIKPIRGSIIVNIAFHSPGIDTMIGPLTDGVNEKTAKYKTINTEDYTKLIISSKLDGKSLIEQMKIQ
ncbi:Oxoglutarate/iron-dependent dioxygenase, partial [Cynara cardunculus var. scolymus]